jgi:hypothetical protein
VLYPEWNADDGDKATACGHYVANCEPHAGDQEPEDVANNSERASTNVLNAIEFGAADCLFPEWQECKLTDDETGLGPRDANNGDGTNQSGKPPSESHPQTAKNEPQKVSDCSQFLTPFDRQYVWIYRHMMHS